MSELAQDEGGVQAGLIEERVKVDRKRFEQMLSDGGTNIGCDADSFFTRVMRSTNTQIMWPPKLKPGTKSKKDPHVRITGSPKSINAAKEIIFEQLDTRRNRVTLKMDVAFTDHSHIIGKGGRSIQRVMDETGCHIHFPDSNRTNTAEKSNQVSIAGSAEGVEQSRCRIREMLPLTLQFDLPLNNGLHSPPTLDPQSPQLQAIQQSYGITITFRCDGSKCSNNSYFASSRIVTVAVRGARSHLFGLRQGLSVLIEYLTGFRANTINVPLTMTIDVAIQHHSFIAGRANCNIRSIMQSTGAVITMPDLSSIPSMASSTTSTTATTAGNNNASSSCSSTTNSTTNLSASTGLGVSLTSNNATSTTVNINNNIVATGGILGTIDSNANNMTDINNSNSIATSSTSSLPATTSSSIADLTMLCGQQQQSPFMTTLTNQTFHGSNPSLAAALSNISNRKTAIVIKGQNFESVYSAWQELLGYLPLILIFDLKEGQDLDAAQVTKLMEQMRQISILIKPKQRQNTKSIVVRGPEKDSRLLFEVRKLILKLDETEMPNFARQNDSGKQQQQPSQVQQQQQHLTSQHQQLQQMIPQQTLTSIKQDPELQMKAVRAILEPNLEKSRQPTPYWAGLGFSKSVSEPMIKEKLCIGPLFSSNLNDERRISYSNEGAILDLASSLQSLSSLDQNQQQKNSLHQQGINNKFFTDINNNNNNRSASNNNNSAQANNNLSILNLHASIENNNNNILERKLSSATSNLNHQANGSSMSGNNAAETSMGRSNTMSQVGITNAKINPNQISDCTTGSSNQPISHSPGASGINNNQKISSCLRLAVFLGRIGLVQYLGLFTQHDIDLEMLFTLTEKDFADLGLPYVHRRKLVMAIAEVKSSIQSERAALASLTSTFDAAPGAERSKRQRAGFSNRNELSDIWSM